MKNKLIKLGVYIIKKLFFPVYDKIWTDGHHDGWNAYQNMQDPDYVPEDIMIYQHWCSVLDDEWYTSHLTEEELREERKKAEEYFAELEAEGDDSGKI